MLACSTTAVAMRMDATVANGRGNAAATAHAARTSPRAAVFVSGAAQRLRSVASAVDVTMAPGSSAAVVRGRTRAMVVISPPFMVDSTVWLQWPEAAARVWKVAQRTQECRQ